MEIVRRHLIVAVCAALFMLVGGEVAEAAAGSARGPGPRDCSHTQRSVSSSVGPVSAALFSFFNSAGRQFRRASNRARPTFSKQAAVGAAVSDAPWGPGVATGISLVRLGQRSASSAAGPLAWLVTLCPSRPVPVVIQGPDPFGAKGSIKPAPPRHANFFLVVLDARDGRFITADYGYSRAVPGRASASHAGSGVTERQILRIARTKAPPLGVRTPAPIQHPEATRARQT